MIQQFHIESIAAILTLICVFLAAKNHILNWPISIVATFLYILVFVDCKFYSDALLQVVFIGFQIYGWYHWKKIETASNFDDIKTLNAANWVIVVLFSLFFWGIWYVLYINIMPNPKYPLVDTGLTIFSLTAIFLQAKKIIENWILWIVVDVFYIPMYYMGEKYQTAILYFILILLSIKGYISWNRAKKMAT